MKISESSESSKLRETQSEISSSPKHFKSPTLNLGESTPLMKKVLSVNRIEAAGPLPSVDSKPTSQLKKSFAILSLVFLTIYFTWFQAIPIAIGIYTGLSPPELTRVNVLQLTENGIQLSAQISFPKASPFTMDVSVDHLKVFNTEQSHSINFGPIAFNKGVELARIDTDNIHFAEGLSSINVDCNVEITNQFLMGRYISTILQSQIDNKKPADVHIQGAVSVKVMGVFIKNIPINQFAPLNANIGDIMAEFTDITRVFDDSTSNDVEIFTCANITHSINQDRKIILPHMFFGVYYQKQRLMDLKFSKMTHSNHKSYGCMNYKLLSINTDKKLSAIESLLQNVIDNRCGVLRISGSSLKEYPADTVNSSEMSSDASKWITSVLSNIHVFVDIKQINSLITGANTGIPKPRISLAGGYADLDGKRNGGYTPVLSGELHAIFNKADMKFFEGLIKVAYVSGAFTFYDNPLKYQEPEAKSIPDAPYEVLSILTSKVPIVLEFKPDELIVKTSTKDLNVQINGESPERLHKWIKYTMNSRYVSGYLTGTVDLFINALGNTIALRNIKINTLVDYKPDISEGQGDTIEKISPQITSIIIKKMSADVMETEISVDTINTSGLGFYLSDIAANFMYNNKKLVSVSAIDTKLKDGNSTNKINVDVYIGDNKANLEEFIHNVTSGLDTPLTIQGFPGCTTIKPIELGLKDLNKTIVLDSSDLKELPEDHPVIKPVLESVKLSIFSSSIQATVRNPVSGQPIYITQIKGVSYYNNTELGNLQKTFIDYYKDGTVDCRKCILLIPSVSTKTPNIPGKIGNIQAILDLLKNSKNGKILVDSDVYVGLLVGDMPLSIHTFRKGVPVEVSF